jgi:quercetin dioxygenase-like cupin family protein
MSEANDEAMPGINIRRLEDALCYEAPNHFDMRAMRLQGLEAGGPEKFWVGLSQILPGGRAGPDAGPIEKVYVVLEGELTLRSDGKEVKLGRRDSCCIGPGVTREIINLTNDMVTTLVVIPRAGG